MKQHIVKIFYSGQALEDYLNANHGHTIDLTQAIVTHAPDSGNGVYTLIYRVL